MTRNRLLRSVSHRGGVPSKNEVAMAFTALQLGTLQLEKPTDTSSRDSTLRDVKRKVACAKRMLAQCDRVERVLKPFVDPRLAQSPPTSLLGEAAGVATSIMENITRTREAVKLVVTVQLELARKHGGS